MENYKVYATIDGAGRILAINSSAFLTDATGWVEIDEGSTDRFHHAQNNYLGVITTAQGVPLYKLADGVILRRTQAEIDADAAQRPSAPTTEERLTALEAAGLERDLALMELAALLTGGV